tara:strand:+ start:3859 stop:4809 length:951 start_codon:yes stop_codon:yes gene_type:complete
VPFAARIESLSVFRSTADFATAIRDSWLVLICLAVLGLTLIFQILPLTVFAMLALVIAAVWQSYLTRCRAEAALAPELRRLQDEHEDISAYPQAASHDLIEPLRKIDAFAGRLEATQRDRLDESGRQYLARIIEAAGRQRRLFDALRELSRINAASTKLEQVDLREACRAAADSLAERVDELDARLEIGELPVIEADAGQMRTLFRHLLANALKYHRVDSPPVITVSGGHVLEDGAEAVKLVIQDNGIGFDDKYADRIFHPFQKLHSITEYQGAGLGLTVARKIAVRQGGSLTASGQVDGGAVFTLILPLRRETLT